MPSPVVPWPDLPVPSDTPGTIWQPGKVADPEIPVDPEEPM